MTVRCWESADDPDKKLYLTSDQREGHVSIFISWMDRRNGDQIASPWVHIPIPGIEELED
jgi:hypothetical protein